MALPIEALKTREGIAYLGGAVVAFLISGILIVGGIQRYLYESAMREATRAFFRDEKGEAQQLLVNLKQEHPEDATVRVLLAALEVERGDGDDARLGVAERLYEEAQALDPTRASAVIGLAVARLKLAALKPKEGRAQAAAAVAELIERSGIDRTSPDAIGLLAATDLMRGRPEQALKALSTPPTTVPTAEGQAAWHWNLAVAAALCRDGSTLEAGLTGYLLRRHSMPTEASAEAAQGPAADAARVLTMAYRVGLADPATKPTTTEALTARVAMADAACRVKLGGKSGLRGRFLPPGRDEAVVWNALGLGLARLERWNEAADAFDQAVQVAHDEPLYLMNLADARYQHALTVDAATRAGPMARAGEAYKRVCEVLADKEGREAMRVLAATNGAAAYVQAGQPRPAFGMFKSHSVNHPDAAAQARNMGALLDWAGNGSCVEEYRKAISLSHPDSAALERRARIWSQR